MGAQDRPAPGRHARQTRAGRGDRHRSRARTRGQPRAAHGTLAMTPLEEIDDLATLTRRAAGLWPEKTAWIFDETGARFTFADVERESTRLAHALLELDLQPGERV